jgi:CheY-like chemotaxis protein
MFEKFGIGVLDDSGSVRLGASKMLEGLISAVTEARTGARRV